MRVQPDYDHSPFVTNKMPRVIVPYYLTKKVLTNDNRQFHFVCCSDHDDHFPSTHPFIHPFIHPIVHSFFSFSFLTLHSFID